MKKKIIYPCEDNLTAKLDFGYAYGRLIGHEPVDGTVESENQFVKKCIGCTKCTLLTHTAEYIDTKTNEIKKYKDTRCVGYSQEYLDNKDKPTATWLDMEGSVNGEYTLEVIFQTEDYRTVRYLKGKSEYCSMLTLVDMGVDELAEKCYDKESEVVHMLMFNIATGDVNDIEFDNGEQLKDCIVSARLLQKAASTTPT